MALFTDTTGLEWEVRITFATIKRVRDRLGLCLENLSAEDRAADRAKADWDAIRSDLVRFVNVLFVLCEGQAKERRISDEQFGAGLDGDTLVRAMEALVEERVLFGLPPERKEAARGLMRERATAIREAAMTESDSSNSDGSSPDSSAALPTSDR